MGEYEPQLASGFYCHFPSFSAISLLFISLRKKKRWELTQCPDLETFEASGPDADWPRLKALTNQSALFGILLIARSNAPQSKCEIFFISGKCEIVSFFIFYCSIDFSEVALLSLCLYWLLSSFENKQSRLY